VQEGVIIVEIADGRRSLVVLIPIAVMISAFTHLCVSNNNNSFNYSADLNHVGYFSVYFELRRRVL
jgi:hypothetical protein